MGTLWIKYFWMAVKLESFKYCRWCLELLKFNAFYSSSIFIVTFYVYGVAVNSSILRTALIQRTLHTKDNSYAGLSWTIMENSMKKFRTTSGNLFIGNFFSRWIDRTPVSWYTVQFHNPIKNIHFFLIVINDCLFKC